MIRERGEELARLYAEHSEKRTGGDSSRTNGANGHAGALEDAQVLNLLRGARNAPKFERLYDRGDASEYGGDDSRADLALIRLMAFYTQDPGQLDRLFRGSGLNREKWERRADYRERTIGEALGNLTEQYGGSSYSPNGNQRSSSQRPNPYRNGTLGRKPEVRRLAQVEPPGPRRYVLDGLVLADYPTLLYGAGGVAKSFVALALAVAVSGRAEKWLGRRVEGGPVLYLDFELNAEEMARRVRELCRGAGIAETPENLFYMSGAGYSARDAFEAAREACAEHSCTLLVLDSWGPALQGDAEAARDVIGFVSECIEPLRAAGVGVLIVDHQSKVQAGQAYQSKEAFGSVYKTNLTRSVIQVEATERGEGTLTVRLRQKKHNFGPLVEPFGIKIGFSEDSVSLGLDELDVAELAGEDTMGATERVKMALAEGPAYPSEISEQTSISPKTVKNTLTGLRKQGVVEATGEKEGRSEQVRLIVPASLSLKRGGTQDAGSLPLSTDLGPGQSATVAELKARRTHASSEDVRKLFGNPPQWLRDQARMCREQDAPERLIKTLAVAVASHLFGDHDRAEEIMPAVEAQFHRLDCGCEECL